MKKIFTLMAIVTISFLCGCNKNFDPVIKGQLTPDNFPKTASDWNLYILGAYEPFGSRFQYYNTAANGQKTNFFFSYEYGHVVEFDAPTDLIEKFTDWGGQFTGFTTANFSFLKTQGQQSHFEKVRYVTRMTKIIDDLRKSDLSEDFKVKYEAEVRTGRAITMYFLLHMYGPLPVILDPAKIGTSAEDNLTRLSRTDYVAAIAADLTFASENLPGKGQESAYGRFNKGLAAGFLMRLYLNEKNWAMAEQVGRQILTMGYSLVNDYPSLFKEATEKNSETIYAIICQPALSADNNLAPQFNAWPWYCLPTDFNGTNGSTISGGWAGARGAVTGTWLFYDSFNPLDKRRDALLVGSYTKSTGEVRNRTNMVGPVIVKYPAQSDAKSTPWQGNDIPVLRYADVLLMLAEAINMQSGPTAEAQSLVNQVRLAHGGTAIGNLLQTDVSSPSAFNDALLRERSWDLFFEGTRKIDLIRMGKWQAALTAAGKNPASPELLPVPQYALNLNKGLTQTPGW
jgi:hypothetical protein